jgi:peptidoglycan hydrolase CwlO-like protein
MQSSSSRFISNIVPLQNVQTNVSGQGSLQVLQTAVTGLQAAVTGLQNTIVALQASITDLQTRMTILEGKVG